MQNYLSHLQPKDLNLLYKHYRVNNIPSLHTLLAGAKGSMPPAELWGMYSGSVNSHARTISDRNVPTLQSFLDADPTQNKKHLEWLLKSYIFGGIPQSEDLGRTRDAIEDFTWLIKNRKITDADITQYQNSLHNFCGIVGCKINGKALPGLEDFLEAYNYILDSRKTKIIVPANDAPIIFESSDVTIYNPRTAAASRKYGAGTRWCTAAREGSAFDDYHTQGPLYILIPKRPNLLQEKYQIHLETGSFMDSTDTPIEPAVLIERFPSLLDRARVSDTANEFKIVDIFTPIFAKSWNDLYFVIPTAPKLPVYTISRSLELLSNVALTKLIVTFPAILDTKIGKELQEELSLMNVVSDLNAVKILIARGVDLDLHSQELISAAIAYPETLEFLLSQGLDKHVFMRQCALYILNNVYGANDIDIPKRSLELFIQHLKDIDTNALVGHFIKVNKSKTAMQLIALLNLLLKNGVKLPEYISDTFIGRTKREPILYYSRNNLPLTKFLVGHGANVNAVLADGSTIASVATPAVAEYLRKNGAQ